MIAAVILTISTVAFVQFALFYWRAMIEGVARQAISDRVHTAAGITDGVITAENFRALVSLYEMAPDLRGGHNGFGGVRMYYSALESLKKIVPPIAGWADAEMGTCARYVAVLMDQHLERNIACANQMRGI